MKGTQPISLMMLKQWPWTMYSMGTLIGREKACVDLRIVVITRGYTKPMVKSIVIASVFHCEKWWPPSMRQSDIDDG